MVEPIENTNVVKLKPASRDTGVQAIETVRHARPTMGEVVIFPGLNPRDLWRLWAEDCIAVGLASPKATQDVASHGCKD